MAEATANDASAPSLVKSSANSTSATITRVSSVRSHVEMTQHPQSPHSSRQVEIEVTPDSNMIQDHGDGVLLPLCCLVPSTLVNLKKEAYTPKVVSIGPFHHGNESLQDMEMHKEIMFNRFIQRSGLSKDYLVHFVRSNLVSKVRASYPKSINLSDTAKLVDLILLDAVFIIEYFNSCEMKDVNDAKLSQPWLADSIVLDLLLLENQLPFFVFKDLFQRAFPENRCGNYISFLELANKYFQAVSKQCVHPILDVDIKHFTDLLRHFYLYGYASPRISSQVDRRHMLSYNAKALQDAGVKLRDNRNSKGILHLKCSRHILEIPQIVVDDHTELLFRNMIALEQCHYPYHACITDYALLLHWLIATKEDVDLLIRKNIVRNYLGDPNNVCSLINGLSDKVAQLSFSSEIVTVCKRLNEYCEDSRHIPWRSMAFFGANILLVLAIVQTIFTVLQVVREEKKS
ncbi:hypothetical protein K1719_013750 [Acacia pycnantha]|nr:hypothetical protein K1719_013750 [Acacia pycnantha]